MPCSPGSDRIADKALNSSTESPKVVKHTPVILNIYDMYWTNKYTSPIGLGVFHSGVQVYNTEYAYGGHRFPFTGIFEIDPRDDGQLGQHFRFRQSIRIGYTDFNSNEVAFIVEQLGHEFRGDFYHLMNNNCNHFSSRLTEVLCSRSIPSWVNRLAHFTSCVPFLQKCLPKDWLTPYALEHNIARERDCTMNECDE